MDFPSIFKFFRNRFESGPSPGFKILCCRHPAFRNPASKLPEDKKKRGPESPLEYSNSTFIISRSLCMQSRQQRLQSSNL